jgi:tetratricopeptide (TPR) repeat protein
MIRLSFVVTLFSLLSFASSGYGQPVEDTGVKPPAGETPPVVEAQGPGTEPLPADNEVMYQVFAAELLGSEGDLQGAVGRYLEAALNSDDPEIAMRATRVAFAAEAWQQASMAADRWALLDPSSLPARESAAIAMLTTSDYVGAEVHLRELLALSPDKEAAWSAISGMLAQSDSPEKATRVLDKLLAEAGETESAAGYHGQSQLAARAGVMDRAYDLAKKATELQPLSVEFLTWASRLAFNRGETETGISYMQRAWQVRPDDHDLTLAYADLLARNGQQEEARKLTREMKQTPDVMLTRLLFELAAGDKTAAFTVYEAFKKEAFEDEQEKTFYLARAAEALDLRQEAISFYQQIEEGELYLPAIARQAELLAMAGDLQAAKKTLAVLRGLPDPAIVEQSWLLEARLFQQFGTREEALQSLDQALVALDTSIPIRYAHALLAAELELIDVAESDLRWVLGKQPENAAALNALGYTLADKTDRFAEAEEFIRRAYELQPEDASITDSMGWVAFRRGRLEEAEEYLSLAWALDNNPEIAAHLGEVLWLQGKQAQARKIWLKGQQVDADNAVLLKTMQRLDSKP